MKKFEKEVLIKGNKEIALIEVNEELLKDAIRVNWESLYFEDGDILAIVTVVDRRFTVDVAGDIHVTKDDELLDTNDIKKLIDEGIDLYNTEGISVNNNNWISLNDYKYRYSERRNRYMWELEEDVVLESTFSSADEFIDYLIGLFSEWE